MILTDTHQSLLRTFFAERPIKKAYLFGSYARNQAGPESDLDILVELDHTQPVGMRFFGYQQDLQDLLHLKVDLLSNEGISRHVKPYIDKEKILIYERDIN